MSITRQLSSKSNIKQYSDADFPISPKQPVIARYQADSTASQTVINLTFPVDTVNAQDAFFLAVDGKILTLGSSADYTMTAIDSLGFSSQATLTAGIAASLNIQAWKLGVKKELEFAQDQRFVSAYDYLDKGFQGFIDTSILMTPTTATGAPAAGTFYSSITGRASMPDLRQDLKPRMGVERIMTQSIMQLQNESGPAGEPVWSALNNTLNQIRFVGNWSAGNSVDGVFPFTQTNTTDYAEITFYGTGLNLLTYIDSLSRAFNYSVDGGSNSAGAYPASGSNVLNARNYGKNSVLNIVSGLSLGVHTIKITSNSANTFVLFGFEILNESSSIKTNPGIGYAQGKKSLLAAQASSSYSGVVTGTKGGRVLQYLSSAGVVSKAWQAVDAAQNNMTSADHTNEEVARVYSFREFGANRTDDFSRDASGVISKAFTLDDGTTALILNGNNVAVNSSAVGIDGSGANGILRFTFIGTGLSMHLLSTGGLTVGTNTISIDSSSSIGTFGTAAQTDRWVEIVSGLPYGTHTVTITSSTAGAQYLFISQYRVYQPKKPTLPSGAIELADYNVMADFVANATSGTDTIATGVMRKGGIREFIYVDGTGGNSWATTTAQLTPTHPGGWEMGSNHLNSYIEYTFVGTGFDFRFSPAANRSTNIAVTLNTVAVNASYPGAAGITYSVYGTGATFGGGAANTTALLSTVGSNILDQNDASSIVGAGFRISGLPFGKYTLRFNQAAASTANTYLEVNCLDIITPIHSAKSNLYADLQNTLPVGSNAISDNRKTTPIKETLPSQKAWAQAWGVVASPTLSGTSSLPMPDMSVTIKTSGGALDISYMASLLNPTLSANYILVLVDGVRPYTNYSLASTTVANTWHVLSDQFIYPVAAGTHKIELYWQQSAAGTLQNDATQRHLVVKEL
jgi:hypothetical protein